MLVLTRKAGQTIRIGEGVVVRVERIGTGRVSISIDAERSIKVMRGELKPDGEAEPRRASA